ncbi:MAG: DUF1624 domain-containing protein [Coxiellaceae bacterium]|nr:MAG: DUF1624 domain-containing protein [Coxiellaceae bacterium]
MQSTQATSFEQAKAAAEVNVAYQHRQLSIDLLRGIALLLMVLDHTRDFLAPLLYSTNDLLMVTPGLFLSRWITHFCAPTFVFLAGVSAFLYGLRHTRKELSQFLLTRGLWLIFLEMTVVTFALKFTLDPSVVIQVIYALGISMVLLAGLVWLPRPILIALSLCVIIGQQLLTALTPTQPLLAHAWVLFYGASSFEVGRWSISVFYSIVPWFAVMSLGYCLGPWFKLPAAAQTKRFIWTAVICLAAFLVIRYFNLFGNPTPWAESTRGTFYTFLSFINVNKYPASLQFLLLMLGIVFLILPLLNKWNNAFSRFFITYGKVSLFFYIIHLYIIHLCAYAYSYFILHAHPEWWWGTSPWIKNHFPTPANYEFQLSRVYWISLLVILIAYPLCAAYGRYKSRHTYKWLSYM